VIGIAATIWGPSAPEWLLRRRKRRSDLASRVRIWYTQWSESDAATGGA